MYSILHCKFVHVYLWLVPRLAVFMTHLWIHGMHENMHVCILKIYLACLSPISGSWSPRSINRESHSSNSVSSKAPSSLPLPPPPLLFFTTCWNEQWTRINITLSLLKCAYHVSVSFALLLHSEPFVIYSYGRKPNLILYSIRSVANK